MDNLAHSLAGLVLAQAGLGRTTRGATAALVIASNLPDIDIVSWALGTTSYLAHHRGLSHSIIGAPLLAVALALLLRLILRGSQLRSLVVCCLAGVAGHVFMDLWTTYGTRVLSPFDQTWYGWDLVFIMDPFVWALLAGSAIACALLAARGSAMAARAASVGLGLLLTYVGARAILHAQALEQARHVLPAGGVPLLAALPSPIDPFYWKLLADDGAALYVGDIDLRRGPRPLTRREKRPEDAVVAQARAQSEAAAVFLHFSKFPWLEVRESADGSTVSWRDLRFEDVPGLHRYVTVAPGSRDRFVARVVLGPDGRIRSESIRF
jgi:inner membrane protein